MIVIGLGANLPSRFGTPVDTLRAALEALEGNGIHVAVVSKWYETAPVPVSDQPWFVNGVAAVETEQTPEEVLAVLHAIEHDFGRVRSERNAARCVDLDLLVYHDVVRDDAPIVPHPRMDGRAFVLLPLRDVAPNWVHPVTGASIGALIAALPADQEIREKTAE